MESILKLVLHPGVGQQSYSMPLTPKARAEILTALDVAWAQAHETDREALTRAHQIVSAVLNGSVAGMNKYCPD